jgi:hypothetical protein
MKLLDTTEIYSKDIPEYFVNFNQFIKICENNGLILHESKPFEEYYKNYKKINLVHLKIMNWL